MQSKAFFKVNEEKMKFYVMRIKFFQYLPYYKYLICGSSLGSEATLVFSQGLFRVLFQSFQYNA